MSFTTNVKNEISKETVNFVASRALLSAILRNSYNKKLKKLELVTENSTICKYIYTLFKELYNINIKTEYKTTKFSKNRIYILTIPEKETSILEDLSVIDSNNNYLNIPKSYILDCDDEKRSYLKGVFLITGSINDPKTSMYHLEFFIDYKEEAEFISILLNQFYLNSKVITRDKGYMVYIKEAEKIGDFLRLINANMAVMYYEDIRIYRDHKNMTNRLNNCEQANMDKVFMTANKQINDIEKLYELDMVDLLDEKLKTVIEYRMKYKESSLKELAEIMSFETGTEITKSGLNHRFRKIREILDNIENK